MITVTFSAFTFLHAKLKERGVDHSHARRELPDGSTVNDFVSGLGLEPEDVEAVFVDGKVVPKDTPLQDGNRLALVPPGSPGPYRVLLGMVKPGGDVGATS